MIRSMTGYGRGEFEDGEHKITCEIRSLNHKYLDLNIRLPNELMRFEERARKAITPNVVRGRLDVFITATSKTGKSKIKVDFSIADQYVKALHRLAERYIMREAAISLELISSYSGVLISEYSVSDNTGDAIYQATERAVKDLLKMREIEGMEMANEIVPLLQNISDMADEIRARSKFTLDEFELSLKRRLSDLYEKYGKSGEQENEARIMLELGIYAEKIDSNEEIVRLQSHLKQFGGAILMDDAPGRKLEFLAQEILREINTIGQKSNNIKISSLVVEIKTLLERIREQTQNVE